MYQRQSKIPKKEYHQSIRTFPAPVPPAIPIVIAGFVIVDAAVVAFVVAIFRTITEKQINNNMKVINYSFFD